MTLKRLFRLRVIVWSAHTHTHTVVTVIGLLLGQEAQLSPRDRAMRLVS